MDFDAYVRQLEAKNWSKETLKAYSSDLKNFVAFLHGKALRITQVTPGTIADYINHLRKTANPRFNSTGLKESSIARRLAAVSGWFEFLRATTNPRLKNPTKLLTRGARRQGAAATRVEAVDEVTLETLMSGIDNSRDRALLSLFAASGLRLSELHQLDVSGVQEVTEDQPNGGTSVWGTGEVVGKGRKCRKFYFDEPTVAALREYLTSRTDQHPALFISKQGKRLSKRAIQEVLNHWCGKLGLGHIHVHQLRHSFATRLANANINPNTLRDLMGHASFDTTMRYFTLSEQTRARQFFAAMEFYRGPKS